MGAFRSSLYALNVISLWAYTLVLLFFGEVADTPLSKHMIITLLRTKLKAHFFFTISSRITWQKDSSDLGIFPNQVEKRGMESSKTSQFHAYFKQKSWCR